MRRILWKKSTRSSGSAGSNCVEVGSGTGPVLVRDTKDRSGGTLAVSADAWTGFLSTLR